jgi:WS/DGAT/MGAT family acyltransferase
MSDRLTSLDASFLEIEQLSPGSHMHIGSVMVFDAPAGGEPPAIERLRADTAARLGGYPRYGCKLSSRRSAGLRFPCWVPDADFAIERHLREESLPAPGDDAALWAWLGDFWSQRLDREHPLWEMVVLRGLQDGRWAIATKTHHCLIDGVSGMDVTQALFDGPDGRPVAIAPVRPPAGAPDALHTVAGLVKGAIGAAVHPRRSAESVGAFLHEEWRPAPATSLNVPIGPQRSYRAVRVPLGQVKAARRTLGGSLNDAVLAAVTSALRSYLLRRDDALPSRPLKAMVPVSVRTGDQQGSLGNRVSSIYVELPVAEADAIARHEAIRRDASYLKGSGAAALMATVIDIGGLTPPLVHQQLVPMVTDARVFNLTVTNVPGPPIPLSASGSPLVEIQPMVPILDGHALGVAVVSYADQLVFGLTADPAVLPDLDAFAADLEAGLEELAELAGAALAAVG